jgi:Lectin C-type domain
MYASVLRLGLGDNCWIGLSKNQWLDGSNSSYRNWRNALTNTQADCIAINPSGKFGDYACSSNFCYICELAANESYAGKNIGIQEHR